MFKAKGVAAFPMKSKQWWDRTITMIACRETPVDDAVSFQWKKKTAGDADFVVIDGETSDKYELNNLRNTHKGEYKCTITFKDGTTSDTNVVNVDTTVDPILGTDKDKFHSARKLYRGPHYQTCIRWDALDKLMELDKNNTLDTPEKFQAELAKDKDLAHVYDMLQRYGYVRMVDSRNGYTYIIDESSKHPGAVVVEGKFKNYWEP